MIQKKEKYFKKNGFTLIELIIYIVIIGAVLVSLINFTWTILTNYQKQTLYQEVRQNGSFALDMINQQIKAASEVVETDSVFNVHPGVLKLDTLTIPFTCGNDSIDSGEYCDGSNLGGQTCRGLYLLSGSLACNQYCRYDISSCLGYSLSRKKIVITNNSSQILQNYQVLIERFSKQEGMDSNFSNLIFLDIETKNQLPYWVEDRGVDWARIWVKVPSIPASSSKTLFLYYGNTGVSGVGGNPSLVMDKAENFEGACSSYYCTAFDRDIGSSLSDYPCNLLQFSEIVSPGRSSQKSFRMKKYQTDENQCFQPTNHPCDLSVASSYYTSPSKFFDEDKKVIEFWMKNEVKGNGYWSGSILVYFQRLYGQAASSYIAITTFDNKNYQLSYSNSGASIKIPSPVSYGQWYKYIVSLDTINKKWGFRILDENYAQIYSVNNLGIPSGAGIGAYPKDIILRLNSGSCGRTDFDLFFSRKYTSLEPTLSIIDDCITSWPAGISPGKITFDTVEKNINRGGQSVTIRKLRAGEDICPSVDITSDAVNVKNFVLKNFMPIGADKENIQVNLTLEAVNPRNTKEYQAEINWQTSINLRL